MELRTGKTKTILEASIDSALLAVEIYNKPRTAFRSQAYITLMIMAWTRLFQAYFNKTIGGKFFYKEKNGHYKIVDGEKKAWELRTCLKMYPNLSEPVKRNLEFFIKLRNKIEHRELDKREVDVQIFGECQALLFNYENMLVLIFGRKYAINESLVYSLQFAHLRTKGQIEASKSALSNDLKNLVNYINTYRTSLPAEVFGSQEYSIRLLQVPKISASSRADLAIEFVKLDELDPQDRALFDNIAVLVKDKKVKVEGINVGRLKPSQVIEKVNRVLGENFFNQVRHRYLYTVFSIRPSKNSIDPFETNTKYCHYDEPHNDYLYNENWVDFIIHCFESNQITVDSMKDSFNKNEKLAIELFEFP